MAGDKENGNGKTAWWKASWVQSAAVIVLLGGGGFLSVEKVSREGAAAELRVTARIVTLEKKVDDIKEEFTQIRLGVVSSEGERKVMATEINNVKSDLEELKIIVRGR